MQENSRRVDPDLISILALLAFGLIAYSNSFTAAFQYDDFLRILRNEALLDLTDLSRIFNYTRERFLPYLSLAINYRISKFDPICYHIFNLFIHYIATIFLYFLFIEILDGPAMQGLEPGLSKRVGAFLAAGIFFLHPLQTESVTYVIQRAESMAGMFYLATLFFYVKARRAGTRNVLLGYSILVGLTAVCAVFSKEIAVTLPVMIVVFEIFFFNTSIKELLRKKLILVVLVPAAAILVFKLKPLIRSDFFYDPGPGMGFTRKQYLLTQFCVLLTYLRLFFWPAGQNIDWDYPLATNFFALQTFSSFLFLLTLLILAFFAYRRLRLLSLGIIAFFITLAPTSSIIPLRDVIFEHRMYLAVAFLAMGCVHIFSFGLKRIREISSRAQIIVPVCSVIILLLLSGLTYARNKVWLSELSLWADAVRKSPNKARVHSNYGRGLYSLRNKATERVKREFETAIRLSPGWAKPYHNLAICYFQEADYRQAVAWDLEAVKREPHYKEAIYQLGRSYRKLNQWDNARLYLERLIALSPGSAFAQGYIDLLDVYLAMGSRDQALHLVREMVQMPDGLMPLDYYRGLAFYKLEDMSKAKFYFVKQTEQETARLSSYLMLGQIHYQQQEYKKAEMAFSKALEQYKWSADAHYNLATLFERKGRFQEASEHLEKASAVDPYSIDTSVRLIVLYKRLGTSRKQTERLRKLLGLAPSSMEYGFLKANQNQDFRQTLRVYEEQFLVGDSSPYSLRAMAIIASLREDYQEAIERYKRYLETLNKQREKQRITNEILRLEGISQGKEPLRAAI
ncbi:MAG: tetratricopeptide repeat protein [Dehalococcoidia bacterium]